jgi:hypothetical protein
MCVVIQKLVKAKSAGVLFTTDVSIPFSPYSTSSSSSSCSEERMLINSSWGLGESVVSSHVTPDTFLVRKPSSSSSSSSSFTIVSKNISKKLSMHVPISGGSEDQEVPPELQEIPSLDDSTLLNLCQVALMIEQHFEGTPQDIEFAIGEEGQVFILQSRYFLLTFRPFPPCSQMKTHLLPSYFSLPLSLSHSPSSYSSSSYSVLFYVVLRLRLLILLLLFPSSRAITTLHLTTILNELDDAYSPTRCYAKYNIGEMIPLAITPLTKSTFTEALNFAFCDFYDEPESEEGEEGERRRHRFVPVFYGHAFFDLTRLLEAGSKILGFDKRKFDRTLCGKEVPETGTYLSFLTYSLTSHSHCPSSPPSSRLFFSLYVSLRSCHFFQ